MYKIHKLTYHSQGLVLFIINENKTKTMLFYEITSKLLINFIFTILLKE